MLASTRVILGFIDPAAFVDRRNPNPQLFVVQSSLVHPWWDFEFPAWDLPQIATDLTWDSRLDSPTRCTVHGYEECEVLQPYHLEIWVESPRWMMRFCPFADGITCLLTGLGFDEHYKRDWVLSNRIVQSGKPCRAPYISDFRSRWRRDAHSGRATN